MTFADLRQTVIQAHTLSLDYFAEDVQIGAPDDSNTLLDVRAKCEAVPVYLQRQQGLGNNEQRQNSLGEREWLRVTVNRNPLFAKAYSGRPQPATPLYRSETRDADRRPFTFRGGVIYEGDQHAVYIFERMRIFSQGRAAGA